MISYIFASQPTFVGFFEITKDAIFSLQFWPGPGARKSLFGPTEIVVHRQEGNKWYQNILYLKYQNILYLSYF